LRVDGVAEVDFNVAFFIVFVVLISLDLLLLMLFFFVGDGAGRLLSTYLTAFF